MCILLIEDDARISSIVAESLRLDGFEVQESDTAEGALGWFEREPGRFSVIVADVELPGSQNGDEAAHEIRKRRPDIPVVLASGNSAALAGVRCDADWVRLPKPYHLSALMSLVHRLTGT